MIQVILFDLDETLYPAEAGIMDQIRELILRYLRGYLNLSLDESESLRQHYIQTYGTTMRGLQINYQIDAEEYLRFVHNIPLQQYLRPNAELDAVLASISLPKIVFTNASREHAERVLDQLGIRRRFSRIVDIRDVAYENKPEPGAYQRLCQLLQIRPEECLIVEDSIRNLIPAKKLGMVTVLVGKQETDPDHSVDFYISRIEEIGQVVQQLCPQAYPAGPGQGQTEN
ncbi:MAG: pyrimidine 5'-nucleotidase [Anaerolineae bacterium]